MPFKSQQQRRWMHANDPEMASRWEDETPKGRRLPKRVDELGNGSGRYTAAFTHPDPLDPNDRVRQKTHRRMPEFPYDRQTRYGEPESQAMDGSKYHDGGYGGQLTPWFIPNDDSDGVDEASETPYMFGRSSMDVRGNMINQSPSRRSFAGAHQTDLDVDSHEVFGETDLRDLQTGELRDIGGMGGMAPQTRLDGEVDLSVYEDMDLSECFAVHNPDGPEVVSLLETLDWDR